jgi:RNA-directed DNA polymerase
VIEPIWEKEFAAHSYGFRPGRGAFDALDRVERLLNEGYTWVVDVDFKSYFDTIPQERLMALVAERISEGRVLALIRRFLKAGVMEGMKGWEPTEQGTPQGGVISPLLANLYLNPLDHGIAKAGWQMTRYADDFVIQCRSRAEAEVAMAAVVAWAKDHGLTVHPQKSRIVDATQAGGFDFLGYHFERGLKWPREKSLAKVKAAIRQRTRRMAGTSLDSIITGLNRMLKGWHAYFYRSVTNVLQRIDQMVRRRLRRILLHHHKRKGNGMGLAHQRWPNAYFERRGLFRLETACRLARQSRLSTH